MNASRFVFPLLLVVHAGCYEPRATPVLMPLRVARLADDRISVISPLYCVAEGLPDCAAVGEYCATMEIHHIRFDPNGRPEFLTIATNRVCASEPIAAGQARNIELVTTEPVPHLDNGDPIRDARDGSITVTVTLQNPTEPAHFDLVQRVEGVP